MRFQVSGSQVLQAVLGALILLATAIQSKASITIVPHSNYDIRARADSGGIGGNSVTNHFNGVTIPTNATLDAEAQNTLFGLPMAYSHNTINWFTNGGQTILSFDVEHRLVGTVETAINELRFTANADAPFTISGFYNGGGSGGVFQTHQVNFIEDGTGTLFRQQTRNAGGGNFTFGTPGGNLIDSLVGTPAGNLIAGRSYTLFYSSFLEANGDPGTISALGNLTLTIGTLGQPGVVPEPLSLLVWVGLIGGAFAIKKYAA